MDADVVVGERERFVWHDVADGRHVTADAVAVRVDGTCGIGPGTVAIEALRFVRSSPLQDIRMGVVTGHTIEPIAALGVATAPGECRCLEPNGRWVLRRDGAAPGTVARAAEPDDRRSRCELGPGDRQILET